MTFETRETYSPITSIRIQDVGIHYDLHVWINHAKSGVLRIRHEELKSVLTLLVEQNEAHKITKDLGGK